MRGKSSIIWSSISEATLKRPIYKNLNSTILPSYWLQCRYFQSFPPNRLCTGWCWDFSPPAALCLQCIHEEKADDCLCSFDDLLQRFPLVPHGVPKLHLSELSANPVQACVADSWIWPSSTPMKSCRSFFTGFFDPAQVFRFSSFKSYEGNTIMFQANKQTNQNLM